MYVPFVSLPDKDFYEILNQKLCLGGNRMKAKRHAKILELIESYAIDTQEELQNRLQECGFKVTQATVSGTSRSCAL